MTRGRIDWVISLTRRLYNPWYRFALAVMGMAIVAVFVVGHYWARAIDRTSAIAKSTDDLILAIGLGMSIGVLGTMHERFQLMCRRQELRSINLAPWRERRRWKYLRRNLFLVGPHLLAMYVLMGWCIWSEVFVLPAIAAVLIPNLINAHIAARIRDDLNRALVARAERMGTTQDRDECIEV
jgi:hypothetical protein